MQNILTPGYVRYDGSKFVTDPSVEIVGPAGPPGPPGSAPVLNSIQIVNIDFIPSSDGGDTFDVSIGGAGFPVSPANYTSVTGKVRIFAAIMIVADPGDNIQAYAIRDGSQIGTMLYVFPVITYYSGQNSASVIVEFLDTVTTNSTHTWGVHIVVKHGNATGTGIVNANGAQIIIEDR